MNMHCIHCGENIPSDSRFCQFCGKVLPSNLSEAVSVNQGDECQLCGVIAPLKYIEFYANIGMLVARRQLSIKGRLCKNCINKYFWKYTVTNIFLGWWGVISFFATGLYIINNTARYIGALGLKKYN
jgi:hypothetical protein